MTEPYPPNDERPLDDPQEPVPDVSENARRAEPMFRTPKRDHTLSEERAALGLPDIMQPVPINRTLLHATEGREFADRVLGAVGVLRTLGVSPKVIAAAVTAVLTPLALWLLAQVTGLTGFAIPEASVLAGVSGAAVFAAGWWAKAAPVQGNVQGPMQGGVVIFEEQYQRGRYTTEDEATAERNGLDQVDEVGDMKVMGELDDPRFGTDKSDIGGGSLMGRRRDLSLARKAKRYGAAYNYRIILEARRAGIPISLAFALVEQESGFRNVFGHDPVRNTVKGGKVTKGRYLEYRRQRKLGLGMQGVGLTQPTWYTYQDAADRMGGCWIPKYQLRVCFRVLRENIKAHGYAKGIERYNGSGPMARRYSVQVRARARKWHGRLA